MTSPTDGRHLLALETGGNQAYIYRSPRLREAIGASALITDVGTTWVRNAVREAGSSSQCEVVVATSGKAVLLGDATALRAVLRSVSLRALAEAPGLEVVGAVVPVTDAGFFAALRSAFSRIAHNRSMLRGPESRFQRLPIFDHCASTGLPAAGVQRVGTDHRVLSHEAMAKRSAANRGWERMAGAVEGLDFTRSVDRLESAGRSRWSAIVHADGSGMGQLFLSFDEHLRAAGHSDVANDIDRSAAAYRDLSVAIEACTRAAWEDAARSVGSNSNRPREVADVVPVLLGGDDLTAVTDGAIALDFAKEYLDAFARETANHHDLQHLGIAGATAGAAVVWTKPGFPFSASYRLAESRLKEAKRRAKKVATGGAIPSVVDVAVLYDTTTDTLEHSAPDQPAIALSGNPYALSQHSGLSTLSDLVALATALGSSSVPSSQAHEIRMLLSTFGVAAADRRLQELASSHPDLYSALHPLVNDQRVLLLDAIDLSDVLGQSTVLQGA